VNLDSLHRRHAVRVAGVATLVVMVAYVLAALVLNVVVTRHLVGNADVRLQDRLADVREQPSLSGDADVDDAPAFLWAVAPSGAVTPLTAGAPNLPARHWGTGPVTLDVGASTFRFDAVPANGGVLVAGQSLASTENVQSTLLGAEIVFGTVLAVAVFAGAMVVGLRASAPSELVRRRQAEFTADASHELRTPISVIRAEVDLALDRPRDPASYQQVLQRIGHECQRLRSIVEDLLWLARADNERVHGDLHDVADLAEVSEACAQRFGAVAATQRVTLTLDRIGPAPFTVRAQPDWIDRLAGVLIDNACKFAGEGGRVAVSVHSAGGRVGLRVDDSGPGIPEDERQAVFDRFHRASIEVSGTGLGLAIADSVVRATQGTWHIGEADLGGARMEVSWRRTAPRREKPSPAPDEAMARTPA
jgi:signal transduction histidine kinase